MPSVEPSAVPFPGESVPVLVVLLDEVAEHALVLTGLMVVHVLFHEVVVEAGEPAHEDETTVKIMMVGVVQGDALMAVRRKKIVSCCSDGEMLQEDGLEDEEVVVEKDDCFVVVEGVDEEEEFLAGVFLDAAVVTLGARAVEKGELAALTDFAVAVGGVVSVDDEGVTGFRDNSAVVGNVGMLEGLAVAESYEC